MFLLGVDPGYRNMGVVLVETNGEGKPRIVKRTTLKNGSIKKWQTGIPELMRQLYLFVKDQPIDVAGVEMISWYGKRRGSLQLAHLAGASLGFLLASVSPVSFALGSIPVRFYTPKEVKTTSAKYGAPKGFDEHQTDALSICRLLAAK